MSRPQALCGYCGKPGRSKEHHWGRWSRKLIPHRNPYALHKLSGVNKEGNAYSSSKKRPGDMRDQSIKMPCRACNMGWMKAVNEAAEPVLARFSAGDWYEINDEEKRALAAWATMFTMTYEYIDHATIAASQYERDYVRENAIPPENWYVMIALYDVGYWTDATLHSGLWVTPPEYDPSLAPMNTQITTSTFGKLLFHTFSTRADFDMNVGEYAFRLGLQTVWPLNGTRIRKPDRPHTDAEAHLIAYGLKETLSGIGSADL